MILPYIRTCVQTMQLFGKAVVGIVDKWNFVENAVKRRRFMSDTNIYLKNF